jgi:hypothetical protein
VRAAATYRLSGPAGGDWTLAVADGACRVDQRSAADAVVTVEADAEDLVAAAQARAAPWVGRLARTADWIQGPGRAEDVVARVTGIVSLASALTRQRIRVRGDRATARRLNGAFWHFWERTAMTEANIKKG